MLGIGGLFRKSPFEPFRAHREHSLEAGRAIKGLVEAFLEGRNHEVQALAEAIARAEERADDLMNEIRDVMPSDVRLPISRRDLLNLLSAQDDIADAAKKLCVLCSSRTLGAPEPVDAALHQLVAQVDQAVSQAEALLHSVDALVEAGFGGAPAERAKVYAEAAEAAADDARDRADRAVQLLFSEGEGMVAVELLLASRVVDGLADAAKAVRHVAGRVRLILAS